MFFHHCFQMFQPNKSTRPASFFKRLFFNGDESSRVWRVTFLCCMANFINAADRVIMPLAINPIADHFKWNMHTHGWVLSAFSVGYLSSMVSCLSLVVYVCYLDTRWQCSQPIRRQCCPHDSGSVVVCVLIRHTLVRIFFVHYHCSEVLAWRR